MKKILLFVMAQLFIGSAYGITGGTLVTDSFTKNTVNAVSFLKGNTLFSCSATVIAPQYAVTATGCIIEGASDVWFTLGSRPDFRERVVKIFKNSGVAILKLASPLFNVPSYPLFDAGANNLFGRILPNSNVTLVGNDTAYLVQLSTQMQGYTQLNGVPVMQIAPPLNKGISNYDIGAPVFTKVNINGAITSGLAGVIYAANPAGTGPALVADVSRLMTWIRTVTEGVPLAPIVRKVSLPVDFSGQFYDYGLSQNCLPGYKLAIIDVNNIKNLSLGLSPLLQRYLYVCVDPTETPVFKKGSSVNVVFRAGISTNTLYGKVIPK